MGIGSTLFLLKSDAQGPFDGSAKGIAIAPSPNVKMLGAEGGFRLDKGFIELARHKDLDNLQAFTIEATITPEAIGGERRNILEAQSPAVALFIEPSGKLVGSVNTAQGWVGVDSGTILIKPGVATRVVFSRDAAGKIELQIAGLVAGSKVVPAPIQNVGALGFKIGAWVDGQRFPFVGHVADVQIRHGAVGPQFFEQKLEAAKRIEQTFKTKTGLTRVVVNLLPDYGNSRLQPIKDIMNAAGVQKLSDLETLRINVRTVMTPGKVLVAARKSTDAAIDWAKIAVELVTANAAGKRELMARTLPNRNSAATLNRFQIAAPITRGGILNPPVAIGPGGRIAGLGDGAHTGPRVPADVLRDSPTLRLAAPTTRIGDLFRQEGGVLKLRDANVVKNFEAANPALWAVTSPPMHQLHSLKTIPVNSAVMIGHTIDLTETELVIEPSVETLYLIAEKLVCGNNAKITWRRPGGETPPRQDNPDLNGRGWSGVHTKHDSRDGLDGEDGRAGAAGLDGAHGLQAPNLEIWVKDMSAIPNLDLNGEDGRKGGRGQRGGRGGGGASGQPGERIWFFGWHCTSDPGDGGDGGDGGNGGRGGRGGNGGNGGKITIAVLEDTLESTVTNRAFKIKNQGGQRGRGGDGGAGGAGGRGGHSGVGETCKDARDGRNGAQGQPGAAGLDGANLGIDGEVRFHEFSLDEWNELLTRPWLSEVTPTQVFPGDRLTLRGSRFSSGDRVIIAGFTLAPTINSDESISVPVPQSIAGGLTSVFVRRQDGTESNRYNVWIKPQLDPFSGVLNPGAKVTLNGRAFVNGASVLVNGSGNPATVKSAIQIEFTMSGTGGAGSAGGSVALQVRNPDGLVSNSRTATIPRTLEIPFRFGTHNLPFDNFTDGVPDWGTYEGTYGTAEVWHELLDPIFGHPILTAAFYGFYHHFLKGKANGGLATGFCTSLASLVADKFWQGHNDTHAVTKASVHKFLTALHGKLLSRESLIHFHDQGREGIARVEQSAREVEATFLRGCDRHNAPLIFFIPSGAIWDSGYVDKLSDSHCVMPYRFVYPAGHPGPQLAPGGATTVTSLDGVEMYVWDCNEPESPNCRLAFRNIAGRLEFDYFANSNTAKFRSQDGITLGMMTNGAYHLADHDLPFSGPLGLTTFVIDFLLSPADLQITDATGLRTGNFGGQILAEIPDSHPCYLLPGAYMLPTATPLTRRITGTGAGKYAFNSIVPNVGSLVLQDVGTSAGQVDMLAVSADGTQLRFTPAAEKTFHLTLARQVGDQARAIAIRGAGGGPAADVDITISPELSVARVGNRGAARNIEVRAFAIDRKTNTPLNRKFDSVNLPAKHDLMVAVQNWTTLDASVQTLSFE
jgi:IPT/TIG domain